MAENRRLSWPVAIRTMLGAAVRFPMALLALTVLAVVGATTRDMPEDWFPALTGALAWSVAARLALDASVNRALLHIVPASAGLLVTAIGVLGGGVVDATLVAGAGAMALIAVPLLAPWAAGDGPESTWAARLAFQALACLLGAVPLALAVMLMLGPLASGLHLPVFPFEVGSAAIVGLLAGWCFLALLPHPDGDGATTLLPRWFGALQDWLLSPAGLLALLTLNGSCVAMAWPGTLGDFDTGTISPLVIAAGLLWTGGWAVKGGGGASRLLRVGFLPGLLLPGTVLFVVAMGRIADDGVTVDAYMMVVASILMCVLGAWQVIGWAPTPPAAAMVVGIVLISVSFGPFGATGVAVRSQLDRLTGTLERYGRFQEGKIVTTGDDIPQRAAEIINAAVAEIVAARQGRKIVALLPESVRVNEGADMPRSLIRAMEVPLLWYNANGARVGVVTARGEPTIRTWRAQKLQIVDTAGFTSQISFDIKWSTTTDLFMPQGMRRAAFSSEPGKVDLQDGYNIWATFDLSAIAANPPDDDAPPPVYDTIASDGIPLRLVVQSFRAEASYDKPARLKTGEFTLLVGPPP